MAKLIDLFIDAGIFLDVSVGGGNVGFWLVVIIVTDKIGDGIMRKKLFEFAAKLCGKRFIVGNDERWPIQLGDYFAIVNVFPVPVAPNKV